MCHCEERSDEAPIKRPLSRGKEPPSHEILIFILGYLQMRYFFRTVIFTYAETSTGKVSAPCPGSLLHQAPIRIKIMRKTDSFRQNP
jgi:hypothetical protein